MRGIDVRVKPELDPTFSPAVLCHGAYERLCESDRASRDLVLGIERPDGTVFRHETRILPATADAADATLRTVERLLKFLLWQKGGSRIYVGGAPEVGKALQAIYSADGERAFDWHLIGHTVYGEDLQVHVCEAGEVPEVSEETLRLGRHLGGCRIGFDLGGSDRKCAAIKDGEVVFTEEVAWNPYFQSDPEYHYRGIRESIRRAAAHLPRVDAIGGSAAGVYVANEPRAASLFRGVSETDFAEKVRPLFHRLRKEWNNVPFVVVNDGEVTALAGSLSLGENAVLGISMGTSEAGGYCDADGHITTWLNELAFMPVDYRTDAPEDEWSGDRGCGVQYFSQQAVARLAPLAGLEVPEGMPFPEQLELVQRKDAEGDERARKIYETIGVYLGYSLAWYARFYEIRHVLLLGRVTTGKGGQAILEGAQRVLKAQFRDLSRRIRVSLPDETTKRHGQAIVAATLPVLDRDAGYVMREVQVGKAFSLHNETADVFVPDGASLPGALARTTHLAIGAHQDDQEFMSLHGILDCYREPDLWFSGVVLTDGRGSARTGPYKTYTDAQMSAVRVREQRAAAEIGEYACQVQLMYASAEVKSPGNRAVVEDLVAILGIARPQTVYLHNPADKHDTHVAAVLRGVEALRLLPAEARPQRVYGCEVWRSLDWLCDADKEVMDVDRYRSLAQALGAVFDTQIMGGKRYDTAIMGRYAANATLFESHETDSSRALSWAVDLTPLVNDPSLSVAEYIAAYIDRFKEDVLARIGKVG